MNEKINIELKSFKYILNKNKSYIFPIIIILISVLLFFQLVIPQFNLSLRAQEDAKNSRVKTEALKENLNIINNIDDKTIDSQFETMTLALPLEKDFIGILNSINTTAQKVGVSLGNFSFKIGNLSSSENADSFPVVKFIVPVNAGISGVNSFVQMISKTFPLVQIDSIRIGGGSSMISLGFYYKTLNTSNFSQYVRVSPISQKGLTLIDQMREFQRASSFSMPQLTTQVATSSASN